MFWTKTFISIVTVMENFTFISFDFFCAFGCALIWQDDFRSETIKTLLGFNSCARLAYVQSSFKLDIYSKVITYFYLSVWLQQTTETILMFTAVIRNISTQSTNVVCFHFIYYMSEMKVAQTLFIPFSVGFSGEEWHAVVDDRVRLADIISP